MTGRRLDYRPDLDGLRAIAVVPVILYHLEIPFFPGGFVGVDVFFVLSGFFITRQILDNLRHDEFTILGFYDRRIRRLFPALAAMLFVSMIAALWLLLPDDLKNFGMFLAAAAVSGANLAAWHVADYFGPDADTLPLLHTWSLAVEEQFYIFFPIILMASWRYGRRYMKAFFAIAFIASFVLSIWATAKHPAAAFYLLPTRIWELGLGCLLAMSVTAPPRSLLIRNLAVIFGLAGIAAAVFFYSEKTPFPGVAAALPCLGCALVIWAGQQSKSVQRTDSLSICWAARPLTWRFVVLVGLVSYSLYLWHWPLIVFSRYALLEIANRKLELLVVIFAVSFASWRFIELPLRQGGKLWPTVPRRFAYAGTIVLAITISGAVIYRRDGFPERLPADVLAMSRQADNSSPERERCHAAGDGRMAFANSCTFGAGLGRDIVVFADSHGAELSFALAEWAAAQGGGFRVRQITASGCPPAFGFVTERSPGCAEHVARMMAGIRSSPKSTVIVTAFFSLWDKPETHELFWAGFSRVLAELHSAGHRIILLGDVPPHPGALPTAVAKWVKAGRNPQNYVFKFDEATMDRIDTRLRALAKRYGATYIPLLPYLCGHPQHCRALAHSHIIYFDSNHISLTTAREVVSDLIAPTLFRQGPEGEADLEPRVSK